MPQVQGGQSTTERLKFCATVEEKARSITYDCTNDEAFCRCFDNTEPSAIRIALTGSKCYLETRKLFESLLPRVSERSPVYPGFR